MQRNLSTIAVAILRLKTSLVRTSRMLTDLRYRLTCWLRASSRLLRCGLHRNDVPRKQPLTGRRERHSFTQTMSHREVWNTALHHYIQRGLICLDGYKLNLWLEQSSMIYVEEKEGLNFCGLIVKGCAMLPSY